MKKMMLRHAILVGVTAVLAGGCSDQDTAKPAAQTDEAVKTCLTEIPGPVQIPAGESVIGSDRTYPEEAHARMARFDAFDMDATEVTNNQFANFVAATGYVTTAEKNQPVFGKPGAAIFKPPTPTHPSWWRFEEGANWRAPTGPGSSINGKGAHPVVQVSHEDAAAYAKWAGRALPSEAQWEYAARGGSTSLYVWGDELTPDGKVMANTWQGVFPLKNSAEDGFTRSAPAGCYEVNGFGLYDMIGNVWEWSDTVYHETQTPAEGEAVYAIKGGSFLCAPSYCRRYRAPARQPQEAGFSTNHIGFRTVSKRL